MKAKPNFDWTMPLLREMAKFFVENGVPEASTALHQVIEMVITERYSPVSRQAGPLAPYKKSSFSISTNRTAHLVLIAGGKSVKV